MTHAEAAPPADEFAALVAGKDAKIDLVRACLLIAADAYPGLDLDDNLAQIAQHALALRAQLPGSLDAEARVAGLNRYLFEEQGFCGNTEDYYDPRNSYLNEVIDRRTGSPLALSVLYMDLGRRIGLPLEGVSFPGHFLVRLRLRRRVVMLDPFCGGAVQSEGELRARLERVVPEGAVEPETLRDLPIRLFMEPASNRQILARLLRNLKVIYRQRNAPERRLGVLGRMLLLTPDAHSERRERGLLYGELECWRPALEDLSAYVRDAADAPDVPEMREMARKYAALCARLN